MLQRSKKRVQKEEREESSLDVDSDDCLDDEIRREAKQFSWWTRKRKFVGAAFLTGFLAVAGYGIHRLVVDGKKQDRITRQYNDHVKKRVSPYISYAKPAKTADSCIVPGDSIVHFEESRVSYATPVKNFEFSAKNMTRAAGPPCILPIEGGQTIDLESRIKIKGIDYDDLNSTFHSKTGIRFVPSMPNILTPAIGVSSLMINSKKIPLSYLSIRQPTEETGHHFYLDISELAEDGYLSKEDFNAPLDVRIKTKAHLRKPQTGLFYILMADKKMSPLPDYLRHATHETKKFPSSHKEVQRLVKDYDGPDEVMAKILYAMLVTDNILEYKIQKNDLPIDRIFSDGIGDCSEYTNLFVTLTRAFGIPARKMSGVVLKNDGSFSGYHAWPEVFIPMTRKDGRMDGRWILVEPTWADNSSRPQDYLSYQSKEHLYFVDFDVQLVPGDTMKSYSVFQENRWRSRPKNNLKKGGR